MSKSSGYCDSLKAKEHTSPNAFAGSLHVWSEQCRVYCCKGDWGLFFWQTEQLCTEVLPNRRNSVALVVSPILRRNGFWRPRLLGGQPGENLAGLSIRPAFPTRLDGKDWLWREGHVRVAVEYHLLRGNIFGFIRDFFSRHLEGECIGHS